MGGYLLYPIRIFLPDFTRQNFQKIMNQKIIKNSRKNLLPDYRVTQKKTDDSPEQSVP